jgi:enoyl-CoA hydratase
MSASDDAVLYESKDHIATITINRPEKRNAISEPVAVGLAKAWRRFNDSDDRVAVLTSAGDIAFSSGRDWIDPPKDSWRGVPNVGIDVEKPIIAALTGWCIGGSLVYPLMADIIIADESVRLSYPEPKVGASGGIMAALTARVPYRVAMEVMLLGEEISLQRLYDVGFINKIVPKGTHKEEAQIWARKIADNAPMVVQMLKRFALDTLPKSPAERFYRDMGRVDALKNSEDRAEAAAARKDKRKPVFKGR